MSQIIQESSCKNKSFYKCDVENSQCKHCGSFYGKRGDIVQKITCINCGKKSKTGVAVVTYANGHVDARCEKCNGIQQNISDLYSEYVGEDIFFDLVGRPVSSQVVASKLKSLVVKIADLPKEELVQFLTQTHRAIER